MEELEKKVIRENLAELIKLTTINTELLSILQGKQILGEEDVQLLSLPGKTAREKVKQLYDVIVTRKNGFNNLVDALEKTNQSGALAILTRGREPSLNEINELSYDTTKELGRGSYGTVVYMGKFGNRSVAVKIVHSNLLGGIQQVLHEVKVLQACDAHENVVRYFGTKQIGDIILIALELCDTSLRDCVLSKEVHTYISPVEVLRQVTTGLAWLHSQKIIHRDLKPENILLVTNTKRVKLADFGLSRQVMDGNSFVATSNAAGTTGWMAPEILINLAGGNKNPCKFTYASDVFSLGCVYYYVLTDGKYAFGDAVTAPANILKGKSKMSREQLNHGCSQNILFINTMINSDPKSRPTCESLLGFPLFWSEMERVVFLEKMIKMVAKQVESVKVEEPCKFDHSGEIKVLKKMGYKPTQCKCIVASLFVECSKGGFREEEHVGMESVIKQVATVKPRAAMNKSVLDLSCETGGNPKSEAFEKSSLNGVKHSDSDAVTHKQGTNSVNRLSVSQMKKHFEDQVEDNLEGKSFIFKSKLKSKLPPPVLQIQNEKVEEKDDMNAQINSGGESCGGKLAQQSSAQKVTPAEKEKREKMGKFLDELNRLDLTLDINQDRLFEIVKYEDLDVIKLVVQFAATKVDITEIWKKETIDSWVVKISLLHVAVMYRGYDVVEYLLNEQGFGNVLGRLIFQNTLVHCCIMDSHRVDSEKFKEKCMIFELLFNKNPTLIESRDKVQNTPLHHATYWNFSNGKQVEFIKTLLRANANVNAKDKDGRTPLHLAVYLNPPESVMDIIQVLIEHDADPDVNDKYGHTFLHYAAWNFLPRKFQEIILYLVSIQRTNSFNIPDNDGWTVLHVAVRHMKGDPLEETLQLLKTHGVNFNDLTNDGDSIIFLAIQHGRSESFLNTLIGFGADWTIKNENNTTALHYAAYYNNMSALTMFIRLKCDVNAKNVYGYTPLHHAINGDPRNKPSHDIINELLLNDADLNLKNNKGESPIYLAKQELKATRMEQRTYDLLCSLKSPKT